MNCSLLLLSLSVISIEMAAMRQTEKSESAKFCTEEINKKYASIYEAWRECKAPCETLSKSYWFGKLPDTSRPFGLVVLQVVEQCMQTCNKQAEEALKSQVFPKMTEK